MLLAVLIVALLSSPASSQSTCGQCFSSLGDNDRRKSELFLQYPGTAVVLMACIAGCQGQPRNDQAICFMAACGFSCLMVGMDNCMQFFTRVYGLEQEKGRICTYCQHNSCRATGCD